MFYARLYKYSSHMCKTMGFDHKPAYMPYYMSVWHKILTCDKKNPKKREIT